jgi:hypothetical protein
MEVVRKTRFVEGHFRLTILHNNVKIVGSPTSDRLGEAREARGSKLRRTLITHFTELVGRRFDDMTH